MKKYNVIGVMSGTSLDGLDIVHCEFKEDKSSWKYSVIQSHTFSYPTNLSKHLQKAGTEGFSALSFIKLDIELGNFIGDCINTLISSKKNTHIDFISSHGHTVFHDPEGGYSIQIGNGNNILAKTGIPIINDFRSIDIAFEGQGAPLVPIGDELLFSEYDVCLNLGGIANCSFKKNGIRIAFDVTPCNILLNYLAEKVNLKFDKGGKLAQDGLVNEALFEQLNKLDFYSKPFPKSLDRGWIEKIYFPILDSFEISIEDKLKTCCKHMAFQIASSVQEEAVQKPKMLVTGGGALNQTLIHSIKMALNDALLIVPDTELVSYKEALIFAFLGVLKISSKNNILKSVTGATKDSSGGVLYSNGAISHLIK